MTCLCSHFLSATRDSAILRMNAGLLEGRIVKLLQFSVTLGASLLQKACAHLHKLEVRGASRCRHQAFGMESSAILDLGCCKDNRLIYYDACPELCQYLSDLGFTWPGESKQ